MNRYLLQVHFCLLLFLLSAAPAWAQFEIKALTKNHLRQGSLPVGTGSPTTTPQFAAKAETSAASSADNASAPPPIYPISGSIQIRRSSFGAVFASGVPRYALGDVITPPTVDHTNVTAPYTFWRAEPVKPGESFTPVLSPNIAIPVLAGTVPAFHYSKHAKRVFAHQAGRVSVTWVSAVPVSGSYQFKTETFSVSSATARPVRTIFWTERDSNAPAVKIPLGRIQSVDVAHSTLFPATVTTEYVGTASYEGQPILKTLWFESLNGLASLKAYNVEGRVFIEYLGEVVGDNDERIFIGADIVDVEKTAPSIIVPVKLGEQIQPLDAEAAVPEDADQLVAFPERDNTTSRYGTSGRPNGTFVYHAEQLTLSDDDVVFYWLEPQDAAVHLLAGVTGPGIQIHWPRLKNKYQLHWPVALADYHGVSVEDGGSGANSSVQFSGSSLPQLIFQDDPAQEETRFDAATQRLMVNFSNSTDKTNRSLLRFINGTSVWYVRLFVQSHNVVATDPDGTGPLLGEPTLADLNRDGTADQANLTATVGQRIVRPNSSFETAGYIVSGTGYLPAAYQNPFIEGVPAAAAGAIIPVNAVPLANTLRVWWFKKVTAPGAGFESFYVPSSPATYTVSYPSGGSQIVMASNSGSGDLSPAQAVGTIYYQNDSTLPGYNPNEEHALMEQGRAYALRDDLNVTTTVGYTSAPFILLAYTDPADDRPAMQVFSVLRQLDQNNNGIKDPGDIFFDYPVTAGSIVQGPMPLPKLPLPLKADGKVANAEFVVTADLPADLNSPDLYDKFTFADRKGYTWVYRGPHAGGTPVMGMQFYYLMRPGFWVPGETTQPAVGTILPYLRPLVANVPQGHAVTGTALTVRYTPTWPAAAPQLRVAETLTLPKFGLPQVRGQSSAEVLYDQKRASANTQASVTLHDPTRVKTATITGGLPDSIAITKNSGRTYFQRLPPHLQKRCYAVPLGKDKDIQLRFEGEFVDSIAGEDYLNLNVLSTADVAALKGLVDSADEDKDDWESAIDNLGTLVETYVEDLSKKGSYIPSILKEQFVRGQLLATVFDSDTAVDSYALTATGQGTGYVTLLFGDGEAFTAKGDPVVMQIIKVVPQLYVGDMKVQTSSNPLDEQVTLRHSGDFAGKPDDFEFEWRYAQPVNGKAPPAYLFTNETKLGTTTLWKLVQNPAAALPTPTEYAQVTAPSRTLSSLSVQIKNSSYVARDPVMPGAVLKSDTQVDYSSGLPGEIFFSAALSNNLDGFVVYVNGIAALAFNVPGPFTLTNPVSGLTAGGLAKQFPLDTSYFTKGLNTIEIALYTDSDPLATSGVNFRLESTTEEDRVDPLVHAASPWSKPNGTLMNIITLGGSPTSPLGSPLLLMQDNYFTVRYRAKTGTTAATTVGTDWSRWMTPGFVPGWVKRVLDGINPFNQRITDLFNSAVNTDVSVLTQAGTRWEGDIALNLDNVNDVGLIAIYETVLNRASLFSINNGYDTPGTNDALLLVAGYLNDLYQLLGNEAYADAANPTIAVDDTTALGEVSTSRFSFEGQAASVLEEELALLRGRDDFLVPGVRVSPAYNRLYWNFTNGINSGEALYATNYGIVEKAGSSTENGVIDAADAYRMFPQAHGDAYGHYLTALKGYYKLITHPNFTWTPRSEAVLVLGQAVSVDYQDERKFASAAASLARTAGQILALTTRQSYKDDPAAGWSHLRDNKLNSQSGERRPWGVDEWASRSTQGSFIHWVVGNAMLPDVDNNPQHTGIQKVDRSTVPELIELVNAASGFQTTADEASSRLNPLGLSNGAISFDISPTQLKAGNSHFEQVYDRALQASLNAKGSFDQAGRMSRLLRSQTLQANDYNTVIEDQERAFTNQLSDIYGTPYSEDIGVGRTYAQNYEGPDLVHWFLIDQATNNLEAVGTTYEATFRVPVEIPPFVGRGDLDDFLAYDSDVIPIVTDSETITIRPNSHSQVAKTYLKREPGQRSITGEMQTALLEAQEAQMDLVGSVWDHEQTVLSYQRSHTLLKQVVAFHTNNLADGEESREKLIKWANARKHLDNTSAFLDDGAQLVQDLGDVASEFFPLSVGTSLDTTSVSRGFIKAVGIAYAQSLRLASLGAGIASRQLEFEAYQEELELEGILDDLSYSMEERQLVHEFRIKSTELAGQTTGIAINANRYQRALEKVNNLIAKGNRLLSEREIFRRRAAAIIQGHRTKDVTFRAFRNEALEQYRSLFDLASRYTYLAAKSYDYETGLLGTTTGQTVFAKIVASRALGDFTGGQPRSTSSTLGDAGLAGNLARLKADFSVAEGRLGINNPDQNGTLFSLRHELFRLLDDPSQTDDDQAWQQTLEQHILPDLMADSDAAAQCNNLKKSTGGRVPGIIIPFTSTITQGYNWFGLPTAGGDHGYSTSSYTTKIYSAGMVLKGYVGMDPYAFGTPNAGGPTTSGADVLSATPYIYIIPVGEDAMLAPPLGGNSLIRTWSVQDQALPLPYNLGASDFNNTQFFNANGTLSEQPWINRKHQAFRAVNDPAFFYSSLPAEFTSSRLIGRSVWNTRWKIVIPAYTLLNNEQEGLNRFVRSVKDIQIFLRTYSHSGN
jgi:hypothetical protein